MFPALATVIMAAVGVAGVIVGPGYYGKTGWAIPDDLWGTLIAAQRLLHLNLASLYTSPTELVSLPGAAVILVPVVAVLDAARIAVLAPAAVGRHPDSWLLVGPYEVAISAVVLFAADAIAERLGVTRPKRFLLAAAGATALWSVTVRWGHPEDAVATGLLLYAILALSEAKTVRSGWLAGAAVAVQPLVLLAFPVLITAVAPGRRRGFLIRAAVPSVLSLAVAAAANWTATIHAVTSQPNSPSIDHPTPWIYLAPHLADGDVAAGPARILAIVAACGCGFVAWHRWRPARPAAHLPAAHLPAAHLPAAHLPAAHLPAAHRPPAGPAVPWRPEMLRELLWWTAVALALRSVFEPVMVSYYLWPPMAVALIAASRDWSRLLPTGCAVVVLTFFSQVSWRNPWGWWTPMIAALGLILFLAQTKWGRAGLRLAPPAQVLPEPGEQFVPDGAP